MGLKREEGLMYFILLQLTRTVASPSLEAAAAPPTWAARRTGARGATCSAWSGNTSASARRAGATGRQEELETSLGA